MQIAYRYFLISKFQEMGEQSRFLFVNKSALSVQTKTLTRSTGVERINIFSHVQNLPTTSSGAARVTGWIEEDGEKKSGNRIRRKQNPRKSHRATEGTRHVSFSVPSGSPRSSVAPCFFESCAPVIMDPFTVAAFKFCKPRLTSSLHQQKAANASELRAQYLRRGDVHRQVVGPFQLRMSHSVCGAMLRADIRHHEYSSTSHAHEGRRYAICHPLVASQWPSYASSPAEHRPCRWKSPVHHGDSLYHFDPSLSRSQSSHISIPWISTDGAWMIGSTR